MKANPIKAQSGWFKPYKIEKGRKRAFLNHARFKNESGAYFIRSKSTGKLLYIGSSVGSLYKTIYRHFQKWKDISRTVQTRFTYSGENQEVKIFLTDGRTAQAFEKRQIIKLRPRDNNLKYQLFAETAEPIHQPKKPETITKKELEEPPF